MLRALEILCVFAHVPELVIKCKKVVWRHDNLLERIQPRQGTESCNFGAPSPLSEKSPRP